MIRSQKGFTLVELLTVVLILGILMAILVPTFLNARKDAQDASAASDVAVAYHRAKVYWVDNEDYPESATMVSQLENDEPGLDFGTIADSTTANAGAGIVGVYASGDTVTITKASDSGNVMYIRDTNTGAPESNWKQG